MGARRFDEGSVGKLGSPIRVWFCRLGQLYIIEAAVATVSDNKRERKFEKTTALSVLEHLLRITGAVVVRWRAGNGHRPNTVLLLIVLEGFYQVLLVLLGIGAERGLGFLYLMERDRNFLALVVARLKRNGGFHFVFKVFFGRDPHDIVFFFFDFTPLHCVSARSGDAGRAVGATDESHCARVPRLKRAGGYIVQHHRESVVCKKRG